MAITGQLWWTGEGDPEDVHIIFVNSDGSGRTVEADNDPSPELVTAHVQDIGLDTAAGWFFAIVNDGSFGNGARLVRGQIGGAGPATIVADFQVGSDPGDSNFDDIIVNALHVDNINEKIYVSYQDPLGDAANTGIRQFGYDPLTGAVVDEGFLVRADLETNKEIDPDNFGLDTLNVRDFDLDLTTNTLYFTELFTGGLQEQGLYRMDLTTHVITQMVSSAQFPDEGANGFIIDVEVDAATDRVYFTTESQTPFGGSGYNPVQNAIWYVDQNADNALAAQLVLVGLPLGGHFYPGDMVIDQDTRRLYVESEEEDAVADDVIYVFELDATGTTATLVETIAPGHSSPFANVQGMAFNALPHLTGLAGTPAAAAEQGAAVTLLTAPPSVTDVDGDHLSSATVEITGGTFPGSDAADNLGVGAGFQQSGLVAGTNITVGWNQLTSTLTLTGYDTLANYQAVLAMVRYQSTGDDPDNGGANPSRTITWTVSDGALGIPAGEQNSGTTTLNIAATDDDPVNTIGGPYAVNEDASVAITGLSVSDVDSDNVTVTLSVGRGTINVAAGPATVMNNGTGTVTISGSQGDVNSSLGGVTYTPTPNVNGPDTLTMTSSSGGSPDVDNASINVAAVNDAPTVAGDGTESAAPIVQDMPSPVGQSVSSLFGGQYSDAADQVAGGSSADAFAGVAVTANGSGASGQWQYHNGVTWVNIGPASDGAAVLLGASTSVRFNPAPGFSGAAPTLTAHLVDASGGALTSGTIVNASVTGGTTRYSTGTVVLSETVIAGNTAPTGVTGTLSVQEVSANGTLVGTLVAADPDSSTFTYTLVNDAGGRFDINSSTGAVTVENGLLLDYEQNSSHVIRVRVDDNEGGVSEFNVNVTVTDRHGEIVIGNNANHIYYGGAETDVLLGGLGSDVIRGGGGIDLIGGGNGIYDPTDAGDQLFGEGGSDIINGNGGDDTIAGGADGDVLYGAEGNDTIYGGASANDATPSGNDVIAGDGGNDLLYGNDGDDCLLGGDQDDQLFGGAGADSLDGGDGVDRLNGGAGADDLTGGAGFDVFIFRKGEANGDEIFDFDGNGNGAGDSIRLEGYAAGTTFTKVSGDTWKINDHGFIEFVTIHAAEPIKTSDWVIVP